MYVCMYVCMYVYIYIYIYIYMYVYAYTIISSSNVLQLNIALCRKKEQYILIARKKKN